MVDYSLYLVADNDPEKLGSNKDLVKIVQDALEGGTYSRALFSFFWSLLIKHRRHRRSTPRQVRQRYR